MKKRNIIWSAIILSAALGFSEACSKTDDAIPADSAADVGTMFFEIFHPAATRVNDTQFESGDRIGLYVVEYGDDGSATPLQISGNWANNVPTAFDGASWTPEKKILWSEKAVDVYAYFPYMVPASIDENPFSVALDQNDGDGYEKSDFLWAKTAHATQEDGAVPLGFSHCCSKLVVELVKGPSYEGDFPEVSDMYIHSTVPTATIDFTTGAVTKYLFGEMSSIKMKRINDGRFEAIIVPQRVATRLPFIEFVSNGVSYLIEDTFNFKAGKQHTIRLTIASNPDQVKIDIGGQVQQEW